MKPQYMVDTNICIYIAKNRPPDVRARFAQMKPGQVVMSAITLGELHFGASKSNQRAKAMAEIENLIQDVPVESLGMDAAEAYGKIRAELQKQGCLISGNDLWIASHAVALRVTLATNNEREFRRVPGLTVENWTK
jgi:tRNA(fMet)-specific endonuclease VapC